EAGLAGAARRSREAGDHFLNAIKSERLRHWTSLGERDCTWGNDFLPTAFTFRDCIVTFPWRAGARLAPRVGELHSRDAPLFMNKADDAPQHLDVPIVPNAKVL